MRCDLRGSGRMMRLVAACALLPVMTAYADLSGGPVEGIAVDSSGKPIADAMVVVKWIASMAGAHGPWYPCYHVELVTTDAQGRFRIPRWSVSPRTQRLPDGIGFLNTVTLDKPIQTYAFAPGQFGAEQNWRSHETLRIEIKPFKGSNSDYLMELGSLDRFVSCAGNQKVMLPLLETMYRDAQSRATSKDDKVRLEGLLISLETAKYGQAAAEERRIKRLKEQLSAERDLGGRK